MIMENQNKVKQQNCVIWTQTDSLYTQKQMIYEDVAEDVEIRFDASNYDLDRPFPKRKKG